MPKGGHLITNLQCTQNLSYDIVYFAAFVAENITVDVTIPTQPDSVTLMSVFGWIIIHQRIGDTLDWNMNWDNYSAGFGSIDSNFWLGLENMHLLTSSQSYRLRIKYTVGYNVVASVFIW